MKFNNRPNRCHSILDAELETTREIWESRSVAVNGVVILLLPDHYSPFVLASKRGPAAADCRGLMNLVAGYLDWDESAPEALYRETWEETGLDLKSLVYTSGSTSLWEEVLRQDLRQPWYVKTETDENRQNISLWYGVALMLKIPGLPVLSIENNEVPGEVEYATWMPIDQMSKHQWAFDHDKIAQRYLNMI